MGNPVRINAATVRFTMLALVLSAWPALVVAPAAGCDVPVFRYALERWAPDAYHAVVFHRGELDADGRAALDLLREAAHPEAGRANLAVHTVDLDGPMTDAERTIWRRQEPGVSLPHAVLLYPTTMTGDRLAWVGPFSVDRVRAVTSSPARQEIARHITGGGTAVWVLLESGDKARDDAAAQVIVEQLALAARTLSLPRELVEASPQLASRLKIDFTLVRVGRDDPAERVFTAMLLGSESDLKTVYRDEPMAFAVFGRGRILLAAVAAGITADNVMMGCRELLARCSCEVKDEHPGLDLLFDVPWQQAVRFSIVNLVELPSPISSGQSCCPVPMAGLPSPATSSTPAPGGQHGGGGALLRNIVLVLGFITGTVLVLLWLLARRRQRS